MTTAALLQALNAIQALTNWIIGRGIKRDRIQAILDASAESGEDITTEIVQAELDALDSEIDVTENLINQD